MAHLTPEDVEKVHRLIEAFSSAVSSTQPRTQPSDGPPQRTLGPPATQTLDGNPRDTGRCVGQQHTTRVQQPVRGDEAGPSSTGGIGSQCSSAISTLQRVRANLRSTSVGRGYNQLFLSNKRKSANSFGQKRNRPINSWTHPFYCLSECNQTIVPCSNFERDVLLEAGLGEKKVTFPDLDGSSEEFRSVLYDAFPKLKDAGGYSFGKCKANSKQIEKLSSFCLQSPRVLRDRVGNARTYIIPMQRSLDINTTITVKDTELNVLEKCLSCNEEIPLIHLNEHLAECSQLRYSSSSDYDPDLPSAGHIIHNDEETNDGNSTLKAAIEEIQGRVGETEIVFEVRREHVVQDSIRNVSQVGFIASDKIKVVFVGEDGVDQGGLLRELWNLLEMKFKDKYFEGNRDEVIPMHDMVALQSKVFYYIGVLIALSVAQGGSGFPHLCKSVYDYLCGRDPNDIAISPNFIPDSEARSTVEKIITATDDEALKSIVREKWNVVMDCGFMKSPDNVTYSDKDAIVKAMCLHHVIFRCKGELDQMKDGLDTLGVAKAIQVMPDTFKILFTASEQELTAVTILELFDYHDTEAPAEEQQTYRFFKEYLEECGNGTAEANLEHILFFFTGSIRIPVGGFDDLDKPMLSFNRSEVYPTSATCSFMLILPSKYVVYEEFKQKMDQGMLSHGGYGKP